MGFDFSGVLEENEATRGLWNRRLCLEALEAARRACRVIIMAAMELQSSTTRRTDLDVAQYLLIGVICANMSRHEMSIER